MPVPLTLRALRNDLAYVQRQLALYQDPYDTVRLMWEQREEALQHEIEHTEGQPENFARVALLFKGQPVSGSEEIRLDFAAKILENYQSVVATLVASRAGRELKARGPLPSAFSSKLFLRDMMRGSVGFLIEEATPTQCSLVPSILKEAVEDATRLIDILTVGHTSDVDRTMREISPRTIKAIQKMAKVLHDAGAETQIVADTVETTLDHDGTNSLYQRLLEVEFTERQERKAGILLGLFPERQQYEFDPAGDAPVFYGPVSESFDIRYRIDPEFARSVLFKPIIASFVVNSAVRGGIPQGEEWVLEDVTFSTVEITG
jgi:hypothetical protein